MHFNPTEVPLIISFQSDGIPMKYLHPDKQVKMAADTMLPWELQRTISLSDIIIEIRDTTSVTDLQVRHGIAIQVYLYPQNND